MKQFCLWLMLCLLSTIPLYGQTIFPPDSVKKTIRAMGVESKKIRLDGKLDEAAWQAASVASGFTQVEPWQGKSATQDTEVRILFDKDYLYVGVFCKDSLGRDALRVPDMRRDFDFEAHDYIGISIDAFNDNRNAMVFLANPYGTQRDLLSFDDRLFDTDWDGLWRVRTQRSDEGWTAEIAIPWQTLRYPKTTTPTQSWNINFFRNRRKNNELSAWSAYPRAFSALRMEYSGKVSDIIAPPPTANIRLQPYVLTSWDRYKGCDVGNSQESNLKAGGELKWAINSNTVLDVTVNTDFAQADVDRQVNNVSRFSVFFPERRQFFLEDASLFGAGLAPTDNLVGG